MAEEVNDKINEVVEKLIEIKLTDQFSFSRICEVLTRIGIASHKNGNNTLYQTAHILHKRGKYYIVHFKQMFELDGRTSTITTEDLNRLNDIVNILTKWNLCTVVDQSKLTDNKFAKLTILPRSQLAKWKLVSKYNIGHKHE